MFRVTDYTDLQRDIVRVGEAFNGVTRAQIEFNESTNEDSRLQWDSIAELRDELHAVANRLENLTAYVTSNPSEVASKMIADSYERGMRIIEGDQ